MKKTVIIWLLKSAKIVFIALIMNATSINAQHIESATDRFKSPPQNVQLVIKEDPKIKKLLSIKSRMNFDDRFKIQLYYGKLSEANRVLSDYRKSFADWPASIAYETPNHKVWVGNFRNRLEADRALLRIQRKFSSAFVFKPDR